MVSIKKERSTNVNCLVGKQGGYRKKNDRIFMQFRTCSFMAIIAELIFIQQHRMYSILSVHTSGNHTN